MKSSTLPIRVPMGWHRLARTLAASLAIAVLAAACAALPEEEDEPRVAYPTVIVALSGAAVVPRPGDPAGSGTARLIIRDTEGQICYELSADNLGTPTAAHIHAGPPGAVGPIRLTLEPPMLGASNGCVPVEETLLRDIISRPGRYYIDLHNVQFPGGAVRGQLAE